MKNKIYITVLASVLIALSGCDKGAPDIENVAELKKLAEGGAGHFIIKAEGKEYIYSVYKNNFCAGKQNDKNCMLANELFSAYKRKPSHSIFGYSK